MLKGTLVVGILIAAAYSILVVAGVMEVENSLETFGKVMGAIVIIGVAGFAIGMINKPKTGNDVDNKM